MIENQKEEEPISMEGFLDDNEATSKWAAKASVFTNLFSEEEYRYQLYQSLHPEDKDIKREDVLLMTLESQMVNQQYNDLGLLIRDRLIILVEVQSTWSENIVVRVLLYLVQTWYKYIKRKELDVYASEKISIPKPELYVIYTKADAGRKPESISLKESFFEGEDICVDCTVKVIKNGAKGDIISQYVRFCRVFDEQVKTYGRTIKAVEETIRICKDENVLEEYLERQREEVIDIMTTLFDQETIMKNHDATIRREGKMDATKLMNYLWSNGRGEEARRASEDDVLFEKLLAEYNRSLSMVE